MKVVINVNYGGFGLSHDQVTQLAKAGCPAAIAERQRCDDEVQDIVRRVAGGLPHNAEEARLAKLWSNHSPSLSWSPSESELPRHDHHLVALVEAMPDPGNLRIIDIPNNITYQIEDYDGREWVAESHRTWGRD